MLIDEWANQSYTRFKNCTLSKAPASSLTTNHLSTEACVLGYNIKVLDHFLELVSGFYIRPFVNISLSLEGTDTAQTLELGHDGYSLTLKMRLVPMIYGIIVEWA